MILLLFILFVVGFFFPPIWLALAGYVIYLFASKKTRRDEAIETRIKRMISDGKEYAVFGDLYFDAARSYAIDKGAQSPEQDAASATIIVNGQSYFATFMRHAGGGTAISARDSRSVEKEIEQDLKDRLGDHTSPAAHDRSTLPSWCEDEDKIKMFSYAVATVPLRMGVPQSYIDLCLANKEVAELLLSFAGEMEQQGAPFASQQSGAAGFLAKMWERLSDADQEKFTGVSPKQH